MKRHKHNLSHYKLLTNDMGELTPVACFEVLPGDSIQQSTSLLLRVSPLVAPVMHPVVIRVHHWFVPYRLLWAGWEEFITGGPDGEGGSSGAFPQFTTGSAFAAGGLADYLGIPAGLDPDNVAVSKLPFRAYNKIFNENYRDQDLVTEVSEDSIDLQKVAWEKDAFTGARPWPQKGPTVTLPLGVSAAVRASTSDVVTGAQAAGMKMRLSSSGALPATNQALIFDSAGGVSNSTAGGVAPVSSMYPSNLYADLSSATAVDINDVRLAFAVQRYQEARAMYGSRFTEYLRYLGIRSSDARLQRPEYLGGGKQTIAFTEVLQTGPDSADDGVANLKGHGIAALRTRPYRKFFEEHGVVLSLMSVLPRTMYGNGLAKFWSRTTKEDFWQKELESIGQQEVYNREVYYGDSAPNDVFGYGDRYYDYRSIQSSIAGEFRSTLNFWHMARIFAGDVTLNSSFVTSDPTKRIHAVQTNDVLWTMASNQVVARRLVGPSGRIPRVL